jgi:hypothetical protein
MRTNGRHVGQAAGLRRAAGPPNPQPIRRLRHWLRLGQYYTLLNSSPRATIRCGAGRRPAKPASDTALESFGCGSAAVRPRSQFVQSGAAGSPAAPYYTLSNSSQPATIPSGAGPRPAAASQAARADFGCGSAALWGGQSWPQPPFQGGFLVRPRPSVAARLRCGAGPRPAVASQAAQLQVIDLGVRAWQPCGAA